jgi:hypothetical protein
MALDDAVSATSRPAALSRHTAGTRYRWNIRACNLNAWCRVPGSPFAAGLILVPNPPNLEPVSVTYGPVELPGSVDTVTIFFDSKGQSEHEHTLKIQTEILDGALDPLAKASVCLAAGEQAVASVTFAPPPGGASQLRYTLFFAHFNGGAAYGGVEVPYVLAYERNPLVDLFNTAGSDKGTEVRVGAGVPHGYALDYFSLLSPFRGESFKLLEIGLEDQSKRSGGPADAPSLRAWRDFFPHATVYGYDIDDFGFMSGERMVTFQGDQGARDDLTRFVELHGDPGFRIVVDDGSHASSHQQISLAALFPCVEPRGLYVIEDLNWQPFEEAPSTLDVLARFTEGGKIESPFITRTEARHLEDTIDAVEIRRPNDAEFAVIRKKAWT